MSRSPGSFFVFDYARRACHFSDHKQRKDGGHRVFACNRQADVWFSFLSSNPCLGKAGLLKDRIHPHRSLDHSRADGCIAILFVFFRFEFGVSRLLPRLGILIGDMSFIQDDSHSFRGNACHDTPVHSRLSQLGKGPMRKEETDGLGGIWASMLSYLRPSSTNNFINFVIRLS